MLPDTEPHRTLSVSAVATLPLLLIPIVISGFFLVFTLVGLILEGDSLALWQNESWNVAWPVAAAQIGLSVCIFAFARYRNLPPSHLLSWSGFVHAGLALVLVVIVYVLTFF